MALLSSRLRRWLADVPWWLARLGPAGNGRALGPLAAWLLWERLATRRARLQPAQPGAILHYTFRPHAGPPVTLRDGTVVRPGDRLLELHLDNQAILRRCTSQEWPPWSILRFIADDLDVLSHLARQGQLDHAVALHGVSLLALTGRRAGFEYRPLPCTRAATLVHFYLVGLAAAYHPQGWQGAAYLREQRWPGELWMSVEALRRREPRSS